MDGKGEHQEDIEELTAVPERPAVPQVIETSPAGMMQIAIAQGLDLDRVERLMELQIKWDAEQARKAFYDDLARFKEVMPTIHKDMPNAQYGSMYASLGNIMDTVTPRLGQFGFSTKFDLGRSDAEQKVTCILTHRLGHSESASETAPPDKSGSKNPIQERKSTTTYLQSITFCSVVGIAASGEAVLDDDGNAAAGKVDKYITEKQVVVIKEALESPHQNPESFLKHMKADSVELILAKDHKKAMETINGRERQAEKQGEREPGDE